MNRKLKRFAAFVMAFVISMPNIVFADTSEINLDGLRVSDEFATKHPHGMFEVVSPLIKTKEGEEFEFIVVRRGGTQGDVSVSLKAIETIAKYDEDFVLMEKGALGIYHKLEKNEDNLTILESYIEENKDMVYTSDKSVSDSAIDIITDDMLDSGTVSREIDITNEEKQENEQSAGEMKEKADNETPEENTAETADDSVDETADKTTEEKADEAAEDTIAQSIEAALFEVAAKINAELSEITEKADNEENEKKTSDKVVSASAVEYSEGLGSYTSYLHKMKDEATGKKTMDNALVSDNLTDFFEVKNQKAVDEADELTANIKGLSYTLNFKDGEAYKTIKVKIIDDKIYESQEEFSISLYGATNGAELGEGLSSSIFIEDNDEVEYGEIKFESQDISVYSDSESVMAKLIRTGNTNDFVNVSISTLADSAKADEHYTPVMGEIMFLPGETEKKIAVPLHTRGMGISENLYFDLTAETEDNAKITDGKTRIEIKPYINDGNENFISLQSDDSSENNAVIELLESRAADNTVTLVGNRNLYKSVNVWHKGNTWYDGNVDLTGINRITWNWEMHGVSSSKYNSRQVSSVRFGNITKEKYKTFSKTEGSISSQELTNNKMRTSSQYYKFNAFVDTDNKINLDITDVKGHLTNFAFNTKVPDNLKAYTYMNAKDKLPNSEVTFSPGNTTVNNPTFNRNWNMWAGGDLSEDGKKYGCTLKEATLTGNGKSMTVEPGNWQCFDSDFIKTYIYNGDQTKTSLTAQARYERTKKVNSINIAPYDGKMGSLKIGDTIYNNQNITSGVWYKGDKLIVNAVPNQGYNIQKINADGIDYKPGDAIPLKDGMTIKPMFQRDDNKVNVTWDKLGTGINEEYTENGKHGIVAVVSNQSAENKTTVIRPSTNREYYDLLSETEKKQIYLSYLKKTESDLSYLENDIPEVYRVYVKNKYNVNDKKEQYKYLDENTINKLFRYHAAGDNVTKEQAEKVKSSLKKSIKLTMALDRNTRYILFNYQGNVIIGNYIFDNKKFSTYQKLSDYIIENIETVELNEGQWNFLFKHLPRFNYKDNINELYLYYLKADDFPNVDSHNMTFDQYIDNQLPVSYKAKIDEEIVKKRNEEIKKKFEDNPEQFRNIELKNLSVGDIVTLAAVTDEGYTCLWVYTDEDNKDIKDNEQSALALHVGDTFTFEVKDKNAEVNYYFEKSSNLNNSALIKGRIVKSRDTLLKQNYFGVNINNPNTYMPLQGIDVTTGNIDPSKSKVINGNTYYAAGQTDENGYFTIYAPNAINNLFANIIFSNGDKQYVKDAIIKKNTANVIFEIPFMDSKYKVEYLNFNNSGSSSKITIADETRTVNSKIDVTEGYSISKVVLRSYNSKGNLVKAWEMSPRSNNEYYSSFNAKEYLKDGGKLTIEAYDIFGKGRGEVETGYTFYQPPSSGNMTLPNMRNLGGVTLPVIGGVSPDLSLGQYDVTPQPVQNSSNGTMTTNVTPNSARSYSNETLTTENPQERFEIAVLSGAMMKEEIKEAAKNGDTTFTTGSITERVNKMTSVIGSRTSTTNATQKEWGSEAAKDSSKGKFYTSGGKANLDVNLDIGFYMSMHKAVDKDGNSMYVFEQLYGLFGVQVAAKKDFGFVVGPVPVYATIAGRIGVKGLVGIMPAKDYEDKITVGGSDGWFKETMNSYCYVDGIIGIFPFLSIGAGVGYRGMLSIGVSGQMNMAIAYQPWKDGAGTVEFSLNVDIDLAIIPISFSVASIKLGMFYTEDYTPNSWIDFTDISNHESFKNNLSVLSALNSSVNNMRGQMGKVSRASGDNAIEDSVMLLSSDDENNSAAKITDSKTIRGSLKHPKPLILPLGGSKQILFYLGDDDSRADYDCQTVYYTVYNGNNWTEPLKIDDNGTYDSDFSASSIGNDRVMIVWGDSDKEFGNELSDVTEYLNSTNLKYCVFEADGTKGENKELTPNDSFSNNMPKITYDEATGRILIAYAVTDYNDTKVKFEYDDINDLNHFINDAYSIIAYKMLDSSFNEIKYSTNETSYLNYENNYGKHTLGNQRFAPVTLSGTEKQFNINEMSVNSYDKKAYLTYTLDTDGDSSTTEDMEIYAVVISFEDNSSIGPIRITNNDVYDSNPHTVKYNDKVWLYWNNNNNVVYTDFDNSIESNTVKNNDGVYEIPKNDLKMYTVQEGADAASTFTVSLEPDGYVYMLWNQLDDFDDSSKKIDKDDLYGAESTSAYVAKRSIYMRVYDPQYEKKIINDEEYGEKTVYSGKWGSAVRIDEPTAGDMNYNEQTFSSKNTKNAVAAFRRYTLEDNGKGGKKESPQSELVIHNYKLVSTLDLDEGDVYISPEHPSEGDDAILYVNVKNVGVLPSDTVTFSAIMEDDKGNKTNLTSDTVNTHLSTDGTAEGTLSFNMPSGTEFIKFHIKVWEDNLTGSAVTYDYTFKSGAEVNILNSEIERLDNDSAYLEGIITNNGNKPTGDMTLKIGVNESNAVSDVLNGTESKYKEILSVPVESVVPGESIELKQLVDISGIWGGSTNAEIYLTLENADETLYSDDISLSKFSNEDIAISDIIVNNGDTEPITLNEADCAYPKVKITPNGAEANYSLEYNIENPEIAEIDPSSGKITGLKPGTTKLIIKAIKYDYKYFVDKNGLMYNPDGSVVKFDENGNAVNLFDTEEGYVAMTKEIPVTVNSLDIKEVIPDEIISKETSETTTETSSKSHGGGSAKRNSETVTEKGDTDENTTEAVTESQTEAAADKSEDSFTDISNHWGRDIINAIANRNIIKGYEDNTFRPNNSITRAEFLTVLYNSGLADTETIENDILFDDINGNEWYCKYVKWGASNNLIVGYEDNTFRGNDVISRQEMAVVISKFIEFADIKFDKSEAVLFADADTIAPWAKQYVDNISAYGIIKGDNNNCYSPNKDLTRAETAVIANQLINNERRKDL